MPHKPLRLQMLSKRSAWADAGDETAPGFRKPPRRARIDSSKLLGHLFLLRSHKALTAEGRGSLSPQGHCDAVRAAGTHSPERGPVSALRAQMARSELGQGPHLGVTGTGPCSSQMVAGLTASAAAPLTRCRRVQGSPDPLAGLDPGSKSPPSGTDDSETKNGHADRPA